MSADEPDGDERTWKALASPTRRRILDLLKEEARTTGALVQEFAGLSRTTVMMHLNVLTNAGLVVVTRSGRERFNHLNPLPIRTIYERWVSGHLERRAGSLAHIKRMSEEQEKEPIP